MINHTRILTITSYFLKLSKIKILSVEFINITDDINNFRKLEFDYWIS